MAKRNSRKRKAVPAAPAATAPAPPPALLPSAGTPPPRPPRAAPLPSKRSKGCRPLPVEIKILVARYAQALDRARPFTVPQEGVDFAAAARQRKRLEGIKTRGLVDRLRDMALQENAHSKEELARMMVGLMGEVLPVKGCLSALSLLDREWYEVCRPMVWEHVNLCKRTDEALFTFLPTILPRHAPLIKSIAWDTTSVRRAVKKCENGSAPLTPVEARVIEGAEQLAQTSSALPLPVRRIRTHGLLVSEVIRRSPNLAKVEFEVFDRDLNFKRGGWQIPYHTDHAFDAVLAVRDRITSVSYRFEYSGDLRAIGLPTLLTACSNLRFLKLDVPVATWGADRAPEHKYFLLALSSLTKLEHLHVDQLFEDEVVKIPSPVKHLRLNGSGPKSISRFSEFVSQFADTLESLELYATPWVEEDSPERQGPPFPLRRLKHLTLFTRAEQTILPRFSASPIASLHIVRATWTTYPEIRDFVEAHAGTLKRVSVQTYDADHFDGLCPTSLPAKSRADLRVRCAKRGIIYEETAAPGFEWDSEAEYTYDSW